MQIFLSHIRVLSAGGVVQGVEHLPNKGEALSSNCNTIKNRKQLEELSLSY
jgi:hypothetical protein